MHIWIVVGVVCALIALWMLWDYRRYAARTNASAVWGWAVTRFLYATTPRLDDKMIDAQTVTKLGAGESSFLDAAGLPSRDGVRPTMVRGVPHRQLDQHPDTEIRTRYRKRLTSMDDLEDVQELEFRPSLWELTEADAFVTTLPHPSSAPSHLSRTKGEFAHLHSHDGSMHMMLSPADLATVISQGWGELFPISGRLRGKIPPVALVYAPRDQSEMNAVLAILRASQQYAMTFQD